MITFIAHIRVRTKDVPAFEALLTHVAEMTLEHEPGVAYYAFSKSVDEPDTYVVVEVYRDRQAHAAHMASEWVTDSLPKSLELIVGKPDIKQYVSEGSEPALWQTRF